MRLSKPIYESLPLLYVGIGMAAIVIAAFNEEGVLGSVVDALPASLCGLATSVIVVSDGARDGTVAEGRAHGASVKGSVLLRLNTTISMGR